MPSLNRFDGGVNAALAPHLIQANQGTFYHNINHVKGTLTPLKEKIQSVPDALQFAYKSTISGEWFFTAAPTDYVEFQEILYIGNRFGPAKKVIGQTEYNLGINGPTIQPDISSISSTVADIINVGIFIVKDIGDIPSSIVLQYRFVNENDLGVLSSGEEIRTVRIGTTNNNASLISIIDEAWTDTAHIYRLYLGDWRLVASPVFNPDGQPAVIDDVYDISANALLDENTLADAGPLTGVLQYAMTFYASIDGTESVPIIIEPEIEVANGSVTLTNLEVSTDPQVDKKRIYRIGGNITTFTLVDTINNPITEYIDTIADLDLPGTLLTSETNFPPPTGGMSWLTEAYAMLFAASDDKLIFTPIGQPNYWPQTFFLDFPAPILGIGKTPVGLLIFTKFETFLVTGTGPLALSQQILSGDQGCVNGDSVVNIQGAVYWASLDGICVSNGGRVIVYTRPKIRKLNLSNTINAVVYDQEYYLVDSDRTVYIIDVEDEVIYTANFGVNSLVVADDRLYGHDAGFLHEINADITKNLEIAYTSPKMIGFGLTIPKVYKNIYVHSDGEVQLQVFINEELVQDVDLTIDHDTKQIKIPSEKTRGFSIAFAVFGKGTVYEISWEDGNANQ